MINAVKNSLFVAGFFCIANLTSAVKAQVYVPPNIFSNPVLQRSMENRNMVATGISGLIRGQMIRNTVRGGKVNGNQPTAGPTSFKASSANSLLKTFAGQSGDPAQQKQAEAFFSQCLQLYWDTARKDEFPSNDLAYAFNYFVVNNYHVYHNVFQNLDRYQSDLTQAPNYVYASRERAVYGQFYQLLGSNPAVKKLGDKEKQQFAETLAIMTNLAFLMYENGRQKGDRELMQKASALAKNNLEGLFQTSANNIRIGDEGVYLSK